MFIFYYLNNLKLSVEEQMSLVLIAFGLLTTLILFLYLKGHK